MEYTQQIKRMIICNECGKELFETEKSDGAAGYQAQKLGFVFKMPFLFNCDKDYTCLFFCNHECGKLFYVKHIQATDEQKEQLQNLKLKIPIMTKDIASGLAEIQKRLHNKK